MTNAFTPQDITQNIFIVCSSAERRALILDYLSANGFSLSQLAIKLLDDDDFEDPVIAVLKTLDFGWNVGIFTYPDNDGVTISDDEFCAAYFYDTTPQIQCVSPEEFETGLMELLGE